MSRIVVGESCTVFEGRDAILLVKAKTLKVTIRLAMNGIRVHHSIGLKKLLETATQITAKKYKRSEGVAAIDDLEQWIAAMQAAIPIHNERMEK
jgi:hypothetical protein